MDLKQRRFGLEECIRHGFEAAQKHPFRYEAFAETLGLGKAALARSCKHNSNKQQVQWW